MNEHEGDPLDETLREIATRYNEPPAAPRDEMWAMIQRRRAETRTAPAPDDRPALRLRQRRPELRWAAAIAAVLILGIGIGRFTAGGTEDAPAVAALRASGAVMVGKTRTPQIGWKAVTDGPDVPTTTWQPWARACRTWCLTTSGLV